MGGHFSADDFFRKVINEILENLLLCWRFGSFDNYPQKNSKISSKKMKKSCFGSAIFLSKCSSLDLQWGQMGRGFSADDFFASERSSALLSCDVRVYTYSRNSLPGAAQKSPLIFFCFMPFKRMNLKSICSTQGLYISLTFFGV